MIKPSISESMPVHHVGQPDLDWSAIATSHAETSSSGCIDQCATELPQLQQFLELVHDDAQTEIGSDNVTLKHSVIVTSGVAIPQSIVSYFANNGLLRAPSPKTNAVNKKGLWHQDIGRGDGFTYMVSNQVSTEHLFGSFMTIGSGTTLSGLATAALITLQARRGLWYQPEPGEVVRLNHANVHRSPRRIIEPGRPQVFIKDYVRIEQ